MVQIQINPLGSIFIFSSAPTWELGALWEVNWKLALVHFSSLAENFAFSNDTENALVPSAIAQKPFPATAGTWLLITIVLCQEFSTEMIFIIEWQQEAPGKWFFLSCFYCQDLFSHHTLYMWCPYFLSEIRWIFWDFVPSFLTQIWRGLRSEQGFQSFALRLWAVWVSFAASGKYLCWKWHLWKSAKILMFFCY